MKVVVGIKRVVDHNIRVRPKADGSDVDTSSVKMSINPFDEHAVEEAVRLKEAGTATEVVAVAIGTAQHQDILRHALAMGADRAILIETSDVLSSLATAKVLRAVVEREQPQLVMVGKQAIDEDAAEIGQMLATLWNVGQGTFASKLVFNGNSVQVTREIDGGQETVELNLPAVVTADLRLNEPRYLKLPNLMQAKKKPLETVALADFGVNTATKLHLLAVEEPPARAPGIKVASIQELVDKLRNEARVI
ncbi:electron transfer flavoprotein subunit beta/FixA family protein [Cellvibrio polysaccharolyticus]|uniref:Electron transfer flavoprotein subunit beta n=1 Tax=Cellvibrio polysaccharolyticus TaxID=2082724 RepID=A0A928V5D4_9GAMM|nr:electron transfer flavoprotein subunit beta/FixA family protein [Cellvibrio polysaccharolyticus]MBE8716419.1 electron transfer flavoprotein subunit beta/FixA family protein [Cellvibrio polysaccharolyticus]